MKITLEDLQRWKNGTLETARAFGLDEVTLAATRMTELEVMSGYSGSKLFGLAQYEPPKVRVFESNPSRYMPRFLREIWNQSGMDHELIGHIYNFYAGLRYDERMARQTQVEFARYRGQNSLLWKLSARYEPLVRRLNMWRENIFYITHKNNRFHHTP